MDVRRHRVASAITRESGRMTRAQVMLALAALMLALLAPHAWMVAALAVPALPKLLRDAASRHALAHRLRASAPLLAAVLIAATWSAAIGGRTGPLASVERALQLAARVVVATLWSSWLTFGRSASQIEAGLRSIGVPATFVALLSATRRFGQQLAATLEAAWAASSLRGGSLSLRALSRTVGAVAGVVVVRSLDRSQQVAVAEAMRGGGLAADVAGSPAAADDARVRSLPPPGAAT
jgi:energy-coupling factor transporter transmembrane protein EcfT